MEKYLALFAAILFTALMSLPMTVWAEPIVVLEYRNATGQGDVGDDNNHPFRMDPSYGTKHKVRPDETQAILSLTIMVGAAWIHPLFRWPFCAVIKVRLCAATLIISMQEKRYICRP